jgi:hypothetical protein
MAQSKRQTEECWKELKPVRDFHQKLWNLQTLKLMKVFKKKLLNFPNRHVYHKEARIIYHGIFVHLIIIFFFRNFGIFWNFLIFFGFLKRLKNFGKILDFFLVFGL